MAKLTGKSGVFSVISTDSYADFPLIDFSNSSDIVRRSKIRKNFTLFLKLLTKGRLVSKCPFDVFKYPKETTQQNVLRISALACKVKGGQIKKIVK